jgi:hypothetical protein
MSDTPERIWADPPEIFDGMDIWRSDPGGKGAEYIRADLHRAEVEALRAELAEMTRRRDEWRKKAEGYDAVRLALREKVGSPWPPHLSRLLWAGIAADEKKRADDAEADREAAVKRALEAVVNLPWLCRDGDETSDPNAAASVSIDEIRAIATNPEALRRIVEGGE